MKHSIVILSLLIGLQWASAQERLSREDALRYAKLAGADTQQLNGTPIPTSVDLEQPVGLHDGEFGGLVLPQTKLTADDLAKAGAKVVPIGQLWLLKLAPMTDGAAVASEQLRVATVKTSEGDEFKVPQCALGVQKNSAGALELLVFGKGKDPVLKAPLKPISAKQESPIEVDAERESESALVSLKILGKYEAKFRVTQLEL